MRNNVGDYISRCAGLALLLEVSAYPKPGNVHRTHDYHDTSYEHFLASSVAIMPAIHELAVKAKNIENNRYGNLRIGYSILKATKEMLNWQHGGNIHLGVILLFIPIAAAAGVEYNNELLDIKEIREKLREVISLANPQDTLSIYEAINLSMTEKTLGKVDSLDILDPSSRKMILGKELKPLEIFEMCSGYDSICSEWTKGYKITFEEGYPYLKNQLMIHNINTSTVNTFLYLLSKHPDTLIQRKSGKEKALEVSDLANVVLENGGASTFKGKKMLFQLDEQLQGNHNSLNPGTTADLTASSLFILTLSGWRP
jgi:triphosphoribosyl-dephospho-CoA synthase